MEEIKYRNLEFMGFSKYRVGTDGSVQSKRSWGWKTLKPKRVNKRTKHLAACLNQSGHASYILIHRLVLLAFVGPCPEGMECCHYDGDAANNNLSNLRWDTRKNNHQDRIRHGTNNYGENNGACKITEEKVLKVRRMWATGNYKKKELAGLMGLTPANLHLIVTGKSWKYLLGFDKC